MAECTENDLQRYLSHDGQQNSGAPDDSEDSEDDQGPGNQQVSSPVFKVLSHPTYPAYIVHTKRLESFAESWTYDHIHTAEDLAAAGFFYAGYADCVRCFQCGLGLRSWKPGDDIYTEHGKHRPNCPFLLALLSQGAGNRAVSQQHSPEPLPQQPTNALMPVAPCNERNKNPAQEIPGLVSEEVKLLARENTILRQQLQCKVCGKAPIRDLFLPCGELYACSECSKLLTHCPSCNKQILATVTTYFT